MQTWIYCTWMTLGVCKEEYSNFQDIRESCSRPWDAGYHCNDGQRPVDVTGFQYQAKGTLLIVLMNCLLIDIMQKLTNSMKLQSHISLFARILAPGSHFEITLNHWVRYAFLVHIYIIQFYNYLFQIFSTVPLPHLNNNSSLQWWHSVIWWMRAS